MTTKPTLPKPNDIIDELQAVYCNATCEISVYGECRQSDCPVSETIKYLIDFENRPRHYYEINKELDRLVRYEASLPDYTLIDNVITKTKSEISILKWVLRK